MNPQVPGADSSAQHPPKSANSASLLNEKLNFPPVLMQKAVSLEKEIRENENALEQQSPFISSNTEIEKLSAQSFAFLVNELELKLSSNAQGSSEEAVAHIRKLILKESTEISLQIYDFMALLSTEENSFFLSFIVEILCLLGGTFLKIEKKDENGANSALNLIFNHRNDFEWQDYFVNLMKIRTRQLLEKREKDEHPTFQRAQNYQRHFLRKKRL